MSWRLAARPQYCRRYGDTARYPQPVDGAPTALVSARQWPADPGREQVAEADHAADRVVIHYREVAEPVHEHDLGRIFDGRVRADRLRVGGHPLRDLGC